MIGNVEYSNLKRLKNQGKDAKAMYHLLESYGFDMMPIVENATKTEMQGAINDFAKKVKEERYEVAFLYYGGHGFAPNNVNYFIPIDAKLNRTEDIPTYGIKAQDVIDQLKHTDCRIKIELLDCCNEMEINKGQSVSGMAKDTDVPIGFDIVYAAQPGKSAYDEYPDHRVCDNGPFVDCFLKCAKEYPNLNWKSFIDKVKWEVSNNMKDEQRPDISNQIKNADQFYLNPYHDKP